MIIDAMALNALVPQYLYPSFRIGGLILAMPMLGTQMVPSRAKIMLIVALTLIVAPLLPKLDINPFSIEGFIIAINQMLIGVIIGMILHVIFQTFLISGTLIAQQMGLGFAMMMDPQNGVSVPAVGQLYMLMIMLIFISVNGHLMAIEAMVRSFETIPVGLAFLDFPEGTQLVAWGGWLFAGALQIALPAVTSIFIVNMAFGVITKAAPQLNIFTLGFPATMIIGLVIIGFSLSLILPGFELMFERTFTLIYAMLGRVDV